MLTLIANAFSAVAGYFGWAKDRQALNNSAAMAANAAAATDQKIKGLAALEVQRGDLDQIRKDAAE